MIFELLWVDTETTIAHHFEGPEGATEVSFRDLCNQLMQEAALDARVGKTRSPLHQRPAEGTLSDGGIDYWIDYYFLTEEVAVRLADYGYKKVTFPAVIYQGDPVKDNVLSKEALAAVVAHNREVDEALAKSRERKRKKSSSG